MYGRQQRRTGGRRRLGQALAAMANANGNGAVNAANATPFGNAGMFNNGGNNVNANAMANGMQNANARRQASQSINDLSQTVQDPNTQFVEGSDYFDNTMQVSTDGVIAPDGDRVVVLSDEAGPSGADVFVSFPQAQPQVPVVQPQCEFPAQNVVLQRAVNITNSAPQIVDIQEDVCGNVMNYTEQMTRTLTAGEWQAVSGLDAGVMGVQNFYTNGNGVIRAQNIPAMVLANSPGQNVPPSFGPETNVTYNNNARVGRRAGGYVPQTNINAGFGKQMMMKPFRGA